MMGAVKEQDGLMLKRLIIPTVIFSILMGLAGCGAQAPAGCNQVTISYPSSPFSANYLIKVYVKGTTTVIAKHTGTFGTSGGIVRIPLNNSYPVGTRFAVEVTFDVMGMPHTESLTTNACTANVESWFEPGDARINRQAYAGAAVYCDAAESRVSIYNIQPGEPGEEARGFPALFVAYDQLPPVPSAEAGHILIASFDSLRFYRLTTGEYQINVGPDSEGKEYIAVWDGCPQNVVKSYIFQDGVQTMTEIYPHD